MRMESHSPPFAAFDWQSGGLCAFRQGLVCLTLMEFVKRVVRS